MQRLFPAYVWHLGWGDLVTGLSRECQSEYPHMASSCCLGFSQHGNRVMKRRILNKHLGTSNPTGLGWTSHIPPRCKKMGFLMRQLQSTYSLQNVRQAILLWPSLKMYLPQPFFSFFNYVYNRCCI
jgi:hypothetical protein